MSDRYNHFEIVARSCLTSQLQSTRDYWREKLANAGIDPDAEIARLTAAQKRESEHG